MAQSNTQLELNPEWAPKWLPYQDGGADINQSVCPFELCSIPASDDDGTNLIFCIAPRSELDRWVSYYWHLGFPDTKVADHVLDHFDRNVYGLRYGTVSTLSMYSQESQLMWSFNCSQKSVQRIRKGLGLQGTIQQAATFETITEIYKVLRERFPTMGARRMVTVMQQEYSIRVPE